MPSFSELLLDAFAMNKKKAKKKPSAAYIGRSTATPTPTTGPSVDDLLRVGQGVGTPLTAGVDYGAGSPAALAVTGEDPLTASTRAALQRALSYLGAGPDHNAYMAPFDQAEARARDAHAAAVPAIAGQYADLTRGLGETQRSQAAQAQQTQANQAASQASQQQLLQNLQAPLLADLQAQGGQAAVGSLTGALQAQMAAGQAGIGNAAAAQQQLSQNLQNAGSQSYDSRIQDARLAEQAAQGNASANLNSILNQIGVQRAGAERQYADDVQRLQAQRQQIDLQLAQLTDAGRASAQQAQDPARILNQLQATDALSQYRNPQPTPIQYLQQTYSPSNPTATAWLTDAFQGNQGDLDSVLLAISHASDSQGKIKYQGKKLDAATLKRWAYEAAGKAGR